MYVIEYRINGKRKTIECAKAELESNLEIARSEADNGECTHYDDGKGEPEKPVTSEILLDILLGGVVNE